MIKINGKIFDVNHFPDNTQMIKCAPPNNDNKTTDCASITWFYENDSELVTLYYIVKHLREKKWIKSIYLIMPYVPNARMDRVKSHNEVFTLKYFCEFINSLNFNGVYVFDTHSYVTNALLNNICCMAINETLYKVISECKPDIVYFPDNGAMKRYSYIFDNNDFKIIYGNKVREWGTGQIKSLDIMNQEGYKCTTNDIQGKTILMVDDIISYGGTMYYSAQKLNDLGANRINIYTSHLENSFFDEEKGSLNKIVKSGMNIKYIINTIYTTNSIYNEKYNLKNFNIKLSQTF